MRRIALFFLCLSMSIGLWAAKVSVDVRLDSVSMFIGNQNRYYLELSVPMESEVNIPVFLQDTLVNGIYILERSELDSVKIDNGRKRLSMNYLLTSFDAELYYIPPVHVQVDGEDYESNYLTLKVMTYDVDTASMEIFDIKPIEKAPFVISDYFLSIGLPILGIALIVLMVYLFRRFYRPKEKLEEIDPELLLPPHEVALKALDSIKQETLWQQGRYKEFYTRLTDVVRVYMSRRFGFSAMEMTTLEILPILKKMPETAELYQSMKELLELSDFVKFAKMNPLPEENERSMRDAYIFVEQTKEVPMAEPSAPSDTHENETKDLTE